jgi:hypothetical protein
MALRTVVKMVPMVTTAGKVRRVAITLPALRCLGQFEHAEAADIPERGGFARSISNFRRIEPRPRGTTAKKPLW